MLNVLVEFSLLLIILMFLMLLFQVYETHARLAIEVGDLPEYNQVCSLIGLVENDFFCLIFPSAMVYTLPL